MTTKAFDGRGQEVALGARLGRGGEGEVFEVAAEAAVAAKVLYPAARRQNKHDKVKAMVARPPLGAYGTIEGFPVLTWPRTPLYASGAKRSLDTFLGYSMVRVHPRDFVPFFQVTSANRRGGLAGQPITWDRLVLLGIRLCHVVRTLHRFGYAVGDLNDRNVLVSRRLTPLFMDTDSFQVPRGRWGHFPSVVGDQMYWAPELLDVDFTTYRGSRVLGDRFALGTLLFQLLMNGLRPYQARGSAVDPLESLVEKTRAGNYPWASPKPGVLEPPVGAPDYGALPRTIRRAFERCFVDGHGRPGRRPAPDDWYQVLFRVREAGYQKCPRNPLHVYGRDLARCPWCEDPHNPFGPSGGAPARVRPWAPSSRSRAIAVSAAVARRATTTPKPPPARRGRRAAPQRPLAPRPAPAPPRAAAAPRPPKGENGPTSRPFARILWLAALAGAFASPTFFLIRLPDGPEKFVTTGFFTVLFVFGGGAAASWRWIGRRRRWLWALEAWFLLGIIVAGVPAAAGLWTLLAYTTGAASLTFGMAVFAFLERGRRDAFRPRARGWIHGALGLPPAYLPVAVAWTWIQL